MKKKLFSLLVVSLMFWLAACGGSGQTAPADEQSAAVPASNGTVYDCPAFSMILAEGWQAGPLTLGMVNVLPKGKTSPGLYFKFEGNGNAAGSAEASINNMVKQYGGTVLADQIVSGQLFKGVGYTFGGSSQTMLVAFIRGTKVTLTIEGEGAWENPDIRAMLKSVKIK